MRCATTVTVGVQRFRIYLCFTAFGWSVLPNDHDHLTYLIVLLIIYNHRGNILFYFFKFILSADAFGALLLLEFPHGFLANDRLEAVRCAVFIFIVGGAGSCSVPC
ncbi:hypothetical protein [Rhizobium skierniewicense]|uniref:hypothetical protein n=1 Tax=Rhizobium skierniewicense TaxID=984260 RepID=UPI0016185775|nr:hypothetical protein [Rhizobium skierniewicense]